MMLFPTLHIEFERWKFNKEYGVWVSNFGNFKDIHKRPIPRKIYQSNGYVCVKTKHGNRFAHRLVMYTWCPIEDREAFTVDHLDHNKRNNRVDNLEWVSQAENQIRAHDDLMLTDAPEIKNAGTESPKTDKATFLNSVDPAFARMLAGTTDTTCRSFIVQEGITNKTIFTNEDGFKGTYIEAIDWLNAHNSRVSITTDKFFFKLCNCIRMDSQFHARKWAVQKEG